MIFFERLLLPAHSRQPVTPLAAVGLVGILVGAGVASTGESFQSKTEGGATMTAYVAMGAAVSERVGMPAKLAPSIDDRWIHLYLYPMP